MRDNHEGMPEIVDAYERDGHYFGVIQVRLEDEAAAFEIGVEASGYKTLRRILQSRPFETTDFAPYRYFFGVRMTRLPDSEDVEFDIRIEQGKNGRQFSFKGPHVLVANLIWFFELKNLESAKHLRIITPNQDK